MYMPTPPDWMTEFYLADDGTSPVEEFLDSLDLKTRARFYWSMQQLRIRNVQAREPLARHLEGNLWELREESMTNIYRVIYFFFLGPQDRLPARLPEEDAEDSTSGA